MWVAMPDGKPVSTFPGIAPGCQRCGPAQGPGAGGALVGQVGAEPGIACVPPALWLTGCVVVACGAGACSTCCCCCCCCGCGRGLRGAAGAETIFFGFGLAGFASMTGGG